MKVGDKVSLRVQVRVRQRCPEGRENNRTARIQSFLSGIEGGVFLDRDLHGCRFWNVEDLKLEEK